MSKRLPRTSQRTLDDLRNAAKDALDAEKKPLHSVSAGNSDKPSKPEPGPKREKAPARPAAAAKPETAAANPAEDARPSAARAIVSVKSDRPTKAAFREASGKLIVERHANLATVAGLIPMPWVDLAAITVIVDRMLRKLARLHGEPLDRQRSKQLAMAMLTGMAAPGIASFATTGLLRMTPGPHLLGVAITSVSAAVLVRVVGEVYLSHLSGTADDADVAT